MIKSSRLRRGENEECTQNVERKTRRILCTSIWEDDTKTDLKEIGW
jgi:hypothetical protein